MTEVIEPKHSFYENDKQLTLEIFDKGVDPEKLKISFQPRAFTYENGEAKKLVLQPLKGEIDPDASTYRVGKVKVEVNFVKRAFFRWGSLTGDAPDILADRAVVPDQPPEGHGVIGKDWEKITRDFMSKEISPKDDPKIIGDAAVNDFFRSLYATADDDMRRAMDKSFVESGGTTLSTNWEDVKKGPVSVNPPAGNEWRKWG